MEGVLEDALDIDVDGEVGDKGYRNIDWHYSSILNALWASYIKAINIGLVINGLCLAFLFGIITDPVKFDYIKNMPSISDVMSSKFLIGLVMLLFCISGAILLMARISSQLLMERQVYGSRDLASKYFQMTETIPPFAIKASKEKMLFISRCNDILVLSGAVTLIVALCFIIIFVAYQLFV